MRTFVFQNFHATIEKYLGQGSALKTKRIEMKKHLITLGVGLTGTWLALVPENANAILERKTLTLAQSMVATKLKMLDPQQQEAVKAALAHQDVSKETPGVRALTAFAPTMAPEDIQHLLHALGLGALVIDAGHHAAPSSPPPHHAAPASASASAESPKRKRSADDSHGDPNAMHTEDDGEHKADVPSGRPAKVLRSAMRKEGAAPRAAGRRVAFNPTARTRFVASELAPQEIGSQQDNAEDIGGEKGNAPKKTGSDMASHKLLEWKTDRDALLYTIRREKAEAMGNDDQQKGLSELERNVEAAPEFSPLDRAWSHLRYYYLILHKDDQEVSGFTPKKLAQPKAAETLAQRFTPEELWTLKRSFLFQKAGDLAARASEEAKSELQKLRKEIQSLAPGANLVPLEEALSKYGHWQP